MFAKALVVLVPISAVLSGCISYGGSDQIKQLPTDVAASARVGSIVVRSVPADVSPEFKPALESELRSKTAACAKGKTELSLEVSIVQVKTQNPALTVLVGSSNSIKGQARFARAETGEVVGDYDISHSVGGGGVLAAVGLSGAEKQMAVDFADEICSRFARAK
ncbi:MAG TPA: hypothetical protein VHT51_04875 [Micropepsaceae bacterium]|nr:hypothetical protein [Micropepsaceae bacterium]